MCSQIIALSLKGVPGIYFHNFMATKNHLDGVLQTGTKRDINRREWQWDELIELIEDPQRINHEIFNEYRNILTKRIKQKAFHPSASQEVLDVGDKVFGFLRTAPRAEQQILVLCNVSGDEMEISRDKISDIDIPEDGMEDLLSEEKIFANGKGILNPYQVVWLVL